MKRLFTAGGLGLLGFLLVACGLLQSQVFDGMKAEMVPHANNDSPVALDLVLVHDEHLTEELLKFSAADWFKRKAQYLRDHPDGVTVHDWELVPGQTISEEFTSDKSWTGFVYANYASPGPHRIQLSQAGVVRLMLGLDDVKVIP